MADYTEEDLSLFAAADLGEKARSFLGTDLGRYLKGCAEQQINDCSRQLLTVHHANANEIQLLQNKAQTASNFLIWVNEAVGMGDNAFQQIQQQQQQQEY